MKTSIHLLLVTLLALPLIAVDNDPKNDNARSMSINIIRLINTAQVAKHHADGQFSEWQELVNSPTFAQTRTATERQYKLKGVKLSDTSEVVPGLELRITVSKDGKSYQISVSEKKTCGALFFSNESGLIAEGKPLGCDNVARK
jgi:hypothetical protein